MAESSMSMDALVDLEDATVNQTTPVDANFTEIRTKFNAMLETATGHSHDGSDSRSVSGGIGGLSTLEIAVARIMGGMA